MTIDIRHEESYISCAANRSSACSSVRDSDGLLAFGSCNLISLWKTQDQNARIWKALSGHKAEITKVKFSRRRVSSESTTPTQQSCLASGDAEGTVIIWREADNEAWSIHKTIKAHPSHSISALAFDFPTLITASSDGRVKVWDVEKSVEEPSQVLNLRTEEGKGKAKEDTLVFALDAEMVFVSTSRREDTMLLFLCLTSRVVSIYVSTQIAPAKHAILKRAIGLKGHTNWVDCLDIYIPPIRSRNDERSDREDGMLLATGSHDSYIRLWSVRMREVKEERKEEEPGAVFETLEGLEELDALGGEEEELELKEQVFNLSSTVQLSIRPYAVLASHTSPVTSLHFSPSSFTSPSLLSTSLDRSLILWSPTSSSTSSDESLWIVSERFGELEKGTNLGFFGALWSITPNRTTVLASGWGGAWHVWSCSTSSLSEGEGEWKSELGVGGHFGAVKGIAWEPEGEWVMSCGVDRTSRIHGRVAKDGCWREVGRPQVHGWEIWAVDWIGRDRFVCAADEKIARVFEDTMSWQATRKLVLGIEGDEDTSSGKKADVALLPALGLSNKAEGGAGGTVASQKQDGPRHPPSEEELMTSTLWPEVDKIYGHGYELFSLSISRSCHLIATACKSTSATHAAVRLFDSKSYKSFGEPLAGHTLTITRMAWSKDDQWLLAVGRDRSWVIWEKSKDDGHYHLMKREAKAHGRIIWDCAFHEDQFFVTSSRDKTIKTWEPKTVQGKIEFMCTSTIKLEDSGNSVCLTTPANKSDSIVMAVGLESGTLLLYQRSASEWQPINRIALTIPSPYSTINHIQLCPKRLENLRLAVASDDTTEGSSAMLYRIVVNVLI
ncbi:WD40 repeat-like protein [Atractiella rhizophila]|nr:WD40 repeat-like protein [Atractiella rhizophila]